MKQSSLWHSTGPSANGESPLFDSVIYTQAVSFYCHYNKLQNFKNIFGTASKITAFVI